MNEELEIEIKRMKRCGCAECEINLGWLEKGKLQEREKVLKLIDGMINFVDIRRASSLIGLEIIRCLKQLQKEIGDEK